MFRRALPLLALVALASSATAACSAETDDATASSDSDLMIDRVKQIQALTLDKPLEGKFERKVRVYGFSFEAKAGAVIKVSLSATAGTDATELQAGAPLDTVAAIYGPLTGEKKGKQLAQADDGENGSSNAQLAPVKIEQDGKYLVVLSSWDDPGTNGKFSINAACEGTDFQCARPIGRKCVDNTRYIQGGEIIGTETWNDCNVVLLEEIHVAKDAVLTIAPGVTVKGNFLGQAPYGSIGLVVDGKLQAVGTPEQPVVFTALKDGWKGLVLNGDSNTLKNVFVEKAKTGIEVHGSNNTFADLNINSGALGIELGENSKGNAIQRIKVSKSDRAVLLSKGSEGIIEDSVLLGRDDGKGVGIEANGGELSQFRRALVAGFGDGLKLNGTALEVQDGTITNNTRGITLTGPNAGVHPNFGACPSTDQPARPAPPAPPPISYYPRDPVFVRCDITKNKEYGIRLDAPELLVVEESNVKGNGAGVVIAADGLNAESRIVKSNVYGNGDNPVQVESFHREGTLNISGNFWNQISDPELSASWKVSHSDSHTCRVDGCGSQNCGSSYTCAAQNYRQGPQGRTYYWDGCSSTLSASWTGALAFTGFSPRELPAGPKGESLCEMVKKERAEQAAR